MPALAAGSVLAVVVFAGFSGGSDETSGASPYGENPGAVDTGLTVPVSTLSPVVIATDPALVKTQLTQPISQGMSGEQVKAMQQRLTELGFQPGPIDGRFGSGTQQALWAFEKLVLNAPYGNPSGVLTNEMWQTMQDDIAIQPRRTNSTTTHVEVYLEKQVLVVFENDIPVFITHISSGKLNSDGTPETFCEVVKIDTDEEGKPLPEPIEKGICAESKTPGGVFEFTRRYEGKRVGPLGGMADPVYFNYGIAVHGAENVPLEPASHGCIRIPNFLSKAFPALVEKGDQVWVWDGKKEPEQQTKNDMLPSFNRPDPNYTTTTSSTTSTTTTGTATTTVTAITTVTATTTKPKSTTTTASPTTTSTTTTTTVP